MLERSLSTGTTRETGNGVRSSCWMTASPMSGKYVRSMAGFRSPDGRIRVLQFSDLVNRHDFIDVIVRHADPTRFDVSVCTLGRPPNIADPEFEVAHIRHWNLHAPARKQYVRAVFALAGLLRRERIDIIHAHHYEPCVIAAAATLLHPHTRLIVGRHYSDAIYLDTAGLKRRAMLAIEGAVNRRAERIIAPSSMIAELLRGQGVPDDRVRLVPYAFEPEKFRVRTEDVAGVRSELSLEGRTVLGTFARLYRDKGHRYLIEALVDVAAAFPEVLLLLVGDGAERDRLEQQVRAHGLTDHVRFLGWRHDPLVVMSAVDIVVQPTLQEAFSQAMVEALWLGKPLLTTKVSAAPDVITHGQNGLLATPGSVSGLRDHLMLLLGDRQMRERLSSNARAVQQRLSIERVIPMYEAMYDGSAWSLD